MVSRNIARNWGTALAIALSLGLLVVPAQAQNHFRVTITNLTSGQVFTPIMVVSHKADVKLFTLGQPASVDLEHLAEAGDNSELEADLKLNPDVLDIADSGAVLAPGKSVTLTVQGGGAFDHLSVAAMLIPTNDGFFALNSVRVSTGEARVENGPVRRTFVERLVENEPAGETLAFFSPAYDAGTEADDELCAHIPGPPTVCAGEGFNSSREGAPNFVFIHSGIHGIGDLKPELFDWRNPVAKIEVTVVP
jgi:spondin N